MLELSPQQREVATMIARGLSSKQIAARMGLALNTVEVHRYRLMKRLGLKTVAGVVHYAIQQGWVHVGDAE